MSFTVAELRKKVELRDKRAAELHSTVSEILKTKNPSGDDEFEERDDEQDLIRSVDLLNEVSDLLGRVKKTRGIPLNLMLEAAKKKEEIDEFTAEVATVDV